MKKSPNQTVVTTISVTVTIIFYTLFTGYVSPLVATIPGLEFVVGIFASVGFYVSVFQILQWVYYKFIVTAQGSGATKSGKKGELVKARRKAARALTSFLRAVER